MGLISKLDENLSLKIPEEILKRAGLKPGDDIMWFYDDITKQIIISEKPKDFAKELRGLGKDTWNDVDPLKYTEEERDSWL